MYNRLGEMGTNEHMNKISARFELETEQNKLNLKE